MNEYYMPINTKSSQEGKIQKGCYPIDISSVLVSLLNEKYIIRFELKDNYILLTAEEELGIDPEYYEVKLTYENFMSFEKAFRLCDNIQEVEEMLKIYIEKATRRVKDFEIYLNLKKDKKLELSMKISIQEKQYSFNIELQKVIKNKDKLIRNLRRIVEICIRKIGRESILKELNNNIRLIKEIKKKFSFCWKDGLNYSLDKSKLVAINEQGYGWNCTVIGNKLLPKKDVSTWEIKIKNSSSYRIMIGIAPYDIVRNQKNNYYNSWTIGCRDSKLYLKSSSPSIYKSLNNIKIKTNDIIGVKVDMIYGKLSFLINGKDYGVACDSIPINIDIIPIVLLYDKNDCIELII